MFAELFVVLVGNNFEEFFHCLLLDLEYLGGESLADWEGFCFGLDFGWVEVCTLNKGYLEGINQA